MGDIFCHQSIIVRPTCCLFAGPCQANRVIPWFLESQSVQTVRGFKEDGYDHF